jgi:hypothetical protein
VDALSFERALITYADGEASFDRLSVSEPGPAIMEAIEALFEGREPDLDAASADDHRFAEMALIDFAVTGDNDEGNPIALSLGSVTAEAYDGSLLDSFVLSELNFETSGEGGDPVLLSLEGVELEDIGADLSGVSVAQPVPGGFDLAQAYGRALIDQLSVNVAGLRIEMPRLVGETETGRNDVVTSTLTMGSLTILADPSGGALGAQFAQALETLGYDALDFSLQSTTVYDPEADRLRTEGENALTLTDGFTLSGEQEFSGIAAYTEAYTNWIATAPDPAAAPPDAVLEPLLLHRLVIVLEDDMLMDRMFASAAAERGTTPQALRAQASALTAFAGMFLSPYADAASLQAAQQALAGFVATGGTLRIAIEPAQPISAAELSRSGLSGQPGALTVTHTPPT